MEDLFTDDFRRHEALRLIRKVVVGEVFRPFRHAIQNAFSQLVQSFLPDGGDGVEILKRVKALVLLNDGKQLCFVTKPVNLIEHKKARRLNFPDRVDGVGIFLLKLGRHVDQEQQQIPFIQRRPHRGHHPLVKGGVRFVDARRIQKNHLALFRTPHSLHRSARGLWLIGHNGKFDAYQSVEQRRFTNIRPADN